MSRIVSSTLVGVAVEAGELFGVPRAELLDHLPDPKILKRPWQRLEWDPFVDLMSHALRPVGTGEALLEAGRLYKRERYNLRSAHLYGQFRSWERAFWVTKHLIVSRLIQGFHMEYKRVEDDFFWFELSLPDHLRPFPDFLYFCIGVWSGSSRQANLKNELRHVRVSAHRGSAELRFDERSLASKTAYNPIFSRWKTQRELKSTLRDEKRMIREILKETENLKRAMAAVNDAVFLLRESGPSPDPSPLSGGDKKNVPNGETLKRRWLPEWLIRPNANIDRLKKTIDQNFAYREKLEHVRDRHRKLFEAVSDIVLVYQSGKPVFMNRQASALMKRLGPLASELEDVIFHHSDRALQGKVWPFAFQAGENEKHHLNLVITSSVPIGFEEGKGLLVTLMNLTPVQTLLQKITQEEMDAKTRIRRDLHDGLSQCLASLALQCKALTLIHSDHPRSADLIRLSEQADRCVRFGSEVYQRLPDNGD